MRIYKVNGFEHAVYDPEDKLPQGVEVIEDWRDGRVGDWVQTDDDCYVQVLRRGTMYKPKGKKRQVDYIGTCTGTFPALKNTKMDSSRRTNIYSFSGEKKSDDILVDRENLNKHEWLFVLYLSVGMDMEEAYLKAFPTNNRRYAIQRASKLIKTQRVRTAMKEELKPIMEEIDVDEKYILKGIKTEAETAEKADTRLKALFKLADIMDLEDKNQTKVTQISGIAFKGFAQEQIEEAERPKEIEND